MKDLTNKSGLINGVLWLAFILAMGASIQHLAWTFGTVERPGWELLGWIPAIAVDTGLAALAYTIQLRNKDKKPTLILWVGVAGFAIVSALANLYHALSVEEVVINNGVVVWIKAVVLSATLPVAYIFLGEIISSNDAKAVAKAEQDEQRRINREEREMRKSEQDTANETKRLELEQRKIDAEQQRILLEQQRQQEQAALEQSHDAGAVFCDQCKTWFKNRQAKAAHGCNKKEHVSNNGTAH